MKATPGTLQEGGASFATTHWSLVAQSALTGVPEAANALAQLCEMYWPPIYSFIRRRGYAPSDAQDLTQSFFAYFLQTKAYARVDPLHGKFRSFLLASVKNFLADKWDHDRAVRRGGGYQFFSLDQETAEAVYDAPTASDSTAERLFELRWAKTLTAGALNSLREELQAEGKLNLFEQHAFPTAHTSLDVTAATPKRTLSSVLSLGLGTTLQAEPFQCNVSVRASCCDLPTAQTSFEATASTPKRISSLTLRLGTMLQVWPHPSGS